MKATVYINLLTLFILQLTSCVNNRTTQHNSSKTEISQIEVIDNAYFEQLTDIIFNSDCFELNKSDRKVITLYYDNILSPDLLLVSIWYYAGYNKNDVEEYYGGLYVPESNSQYLFLIKKFQNIPDGIFKQTKDKIDISEFLGAIEGSDSNIGIKKVDGQLKIVYVNCPEFE